MKSAAEPRTPLPRGAALFDRIDYRLIESPEEKDDLYLMRYRAYLHAGLIAPLESRRVTDRFDEAPNTWNFGVYVDGELCSSVRIHVLTSEWRMSRTIEVFGDILHPRLDRNEVFVDPTFFVVDPDKHKRFPELPYLTARLGFVACDHFDADAGLAVVRTVHQSFYRRVFLHEAISPEPRGFPGWPFEKVVLMASDFRNQREKVLARFPIMRSSAFERRMLFEKASIVRLPSLQTAKRRLATIHGTQAVELQETVEIGLIARLETVPVTQPTNDIQRETAEIIHRISQWAGGDDKARYWFRSEGIPAFGGRTAEALVRQGRAAEVRDFLDHVALGGYA